MAFKYGNLKVPPPPKVETEEDKLKQKHAMFANMKGKGGSGPKVVVAIVAPKTSGKLPMPGKKKK